MTLAQVVQDRLQTLSDSKLDVWQDMASRWPAGSTAPINSDAFLSLIVEVKRQRAELHRLTEIAEGYDGMVIRLGEVTTKLEAANALLRQCVENREGLAYEWKLLDEIQSHLKGAGDEA